MYKENFINKHEDLVKIGSFLYFKIVGKIKVKAIMLFVINRAIDSFRNFKKEFEFSIVSVFKLFKVPVLLQLMIEKNRKTELNLMSNKKGN